MPIFASNFASNSLSGTATVIAGNVTINLAPAAFALEGDRTFVVKLRKGSSQAAVIATSPVVTIKDRTTFVSLTANTATVAEGNLVAFSLVTTNVLNGATVYYSVLPATANVTADDFTANTGSAVITNNAATFALKANADVSLSNEDGETFKVQLRTNSPTGNVVFATSNVEILDTYKTYNILGLISGSASPVVSGSNVTFTFSATNVPAGTILFYNTTGNLTSFSSNTGSFALNSISNTFVITNPQAPFAASRSFNAIVRSGSASGPIVATSNAMVVVDAAILPYTFATGGNVTVSGGYRTHTFTTSGNLIVSAVGISNTVEYLVVAGGGGGQRGDSVWSSGGGGGAGGYLTANLAVSSESPITVTVGAGGGSGTAGSNSTFSSITSTGGGTGGGTSPQPSNNGGSGGGDSGYAGGKGTGIAGQGNPGGTGYGQQRFGGGGGGAGAVGGSPSGTGGLYGSPSIAGVGGIGLQSSISGSAIYYAGGGGGGAREITGEATYYAGDGGTGGGGAGQYSAGPSAVAGTVNRGGGGGGGGSYGPGPATITSGGVGGAGGSGIVVLRYPYADGPTFASITTPANFVYEGSNVVFTLSTTDVSNNTLLYYYTVGNILSSHFVTGNTGSFRTTLNSTTITLPTNSTIPVSEERFFQLRIAGDAGTSQDPLITSNVFTVKGSELQPKTSSIQYLVVAGGGGGGGQNGGGGGGAGGYLANSAYPITPATPYIITVGGGGAGAPGSIPPPYSNSPRGGSGGNSSISTGVVSFGGGGGGTFYGAPLYDAGVPGGSGGAGRFSNQTLNSSQPQAGLAIGSPGWNVAGSQGYPAGRSSQNPQGKAGGGGGAGQTGFDGAPPGGTGGKGGDGLQTSISGAATYYAGGGAGIGQDGGGAPGGLGGGGGAGVQGDPRMNGNVNTGGGGAGMGTDSPSYSGGAGGAGIVIIRYPDIYATATTTGSPNVIYANANIIYRFWQTGSITFP